MKYDLIVVGGGPAGIMAAGRAGEQGARVLLLEKNPRLGLKLLITGKGRCNITNNLSDIREFTKEFGKNGNFLFSSLTKFGTSDIMDFFEERGLKLKIERGERVFPSTDNAQDVLDSLLVYLDKSRVEVKTNMKVEKIAKENNLIKNIEVVSGEKFTADNYLIATGGMSYPGTGSSGDGYFWARELGHSILKPTPSLTPIICRERFIKKLEGLSLKNVEISIYSNNKKIDSRFGEALFTANGMSGPIVLDMSKIVSHRKASELRIDFKPRLDFSELDKRVQNDFKEQNNKQFKNSLDKLLPQKLIPVIIDLSGINPEKKVNLITKEERKKIIHLLKEFNLKLDGVVGFSKAIVTAGGIILSEIDPKTMRSKKIKNLYFAGEILDLDGPTGGYNLQVCWSTGFSAGDNIISNKKI